MSRACAGTCRRTLRDRLPIDRASPTTIRVERTCRALSSGIEPWPGGYGSPRCSALKTGIKATEPEQVLAAQSLRRLAGTGSRARDSARRLLARVRCVRGGPCCSLPSLPAPRGSGDALRPTRRESTGKSPSAREYNETALRAVWATAASAGVRA